MTQRHGVPAGASDKAGGGGSAGPSGPGWRATAWVAAGALVMSSAVVALPAPAALAPHAELKLTANDAAAGDEFGYSVAVAGDTVVVGAPFDDDNGDDSGSVYVFGPDGSRGYLQRAKLTAPDAATGDWFGYSVAVARDTVVVGAPFDDDNGEDSGSVYVFGPDGSGAWAQQAKLTASDAGVDDRFGRAVAVAGDRIVVGAPGDDDNPGSAYVFGPDGSGGWAQQAKLIASDAAYGDHFGTSVAVAGDTIVVGAYGDDDDGFSAGSAYVFGPDGSRGYVQRAKLTASDAAAGDLFGTSVAVAGDTIVVRASRHQHSFGCPIGVAGQSTPPGSVYVFGPDGSGGFTQQAELTASGGAVAVDGGTIMVAEQCDLEFLGVGWVDVFGPDGSGGWAQQAKLIASDAAYGDRFGNSVAVAGDTIVVGAIGDDDDGADSGAAYVYRPATPATPVGPPAPSVPTCGADGVLNPPAAQAGVVWSVDPAGQTGPGSYVVTAAPAPGYYIPAGAQATWTITVAARLTEGCTPPGPPVPTVSVRAVWGGKRLFVNVNPNKGRGYWQFTVQKLVKGKWRARSKVYKTWGKYETRRLRLSRGTYRVMVLPRYGYGGAISEVVSLRSAPAAVAHLDRGVAASVTVRAESGKSKLHVNVNPNMGRGYWQFTVQKYRGGQWRALSKVYKTYRSSETRRLNLGRGTYRVIVMSQYRYDPVVSDTVRLRR